MRTSARHVTIALVAVSIILAAYTADRAWAWRSEVNSQHARDAAIAAASAEVTRLITVSDRNAATSIPALLDGATASFQANLKADAAQLRKALAAERVLASGTVASAGIGTSTSDTATVYVAADGTVSNATSAAPQPRQYRVKVDLREVGGRWLVSELVFVA